MLTSQVRSQQVTEKGYTSDIISQEPLVIIAAVMMDPFGIKTVYSAMTVKKRGFERSAEEIWVPRSNETIQQMMQTTLLKACALLPGRGTVYWTGFGLDDLNVLARGEIKFVAIDKNDNPNYQIADNLAVTSWLEAYETQRR